MGIDVERLKHFKLPVIRTTKDFFGCLHLEQKDKFNYLVKRGSNYSEYTLKTKNGKYRTISIPDPKLKAIQTTIGRIFFDRIQKPECCCGYTKHRSILDNAKPHLGCKTLFKFDISDFFETIKIDRIIKQLMWYGYDQKVAKNIGLLCVKENYSLPQGSPSSPSISNIVALKLDYRIMEFCNSTKGKYGLKYTRYADDLTLSAKFKLSKKDVIIIQSFIIQLIRNEGFRPNYKKCKMFRNGQKLLVTGIVVNNEKPCVRKDIIREIENAITYTDKYGLDEHIRCSKNIDISYSSISNGKRKYIDHIYGLISYCSMIDKEKGRTLFEKWEKTVNEI